MYKVSTITFTSRALRVIRNTPGAPEVIKNTPRAPGVIKNTPGALGVMKNYPLGPGGYEKILPIASCFDPAKGLLKGCIMLRPTHPTTLVTFTFTPGAPGVIKNTPPGPRGLSQIPGTLGVIKSTPQKSFPKHPKHR